MLENIYNHWPDSYNIKISNVGCIITAAEYYILINRNQVVDLFIKKKKLKIPATKGNRDLAISGNLRNSEYLN